MGELQANQRVVVGARLQHTNTSKVRTAQQLIVELQHKHTRGRKSGEPLAISKKTLVVVVRQALHTVPESLNENGG